MTDELLWSETTGLFSNQEFRLLIYRGTRLTPPALFDYLLNGHFLHCCHQDTFPSLVKETGQLFLKLLFNGSPSGSMELLIFMDAPSREIIAARGGGASRPMGPWMAKGEYMGPSSSCHLALIYFLTKPSLTIPRPPCIITLPYQTFPNLTIFI